MMEPRVLRRSEDKRATLWQCSDCGQPFTLGWGSQCNRCITEERRHREIVAALRSGPQMDPNNETAQSLEL